MSPAPHSSARVHPRTSGSLVPLALQQRLAWKAYSQTGPFSERRCEASLRILGDLNVSLLRECLDILTGRHEALRTRIVLVGDTPMQEVVPVQECKLEAIDATGCADSHASGGVEQLAREFLYQKVDYLTDPIFACQLLKVSDAEHILLLGIDHLVTDGASSSIVSAELAALYRQAERRMQPALPGAVLQYGDYVMWQLQGLEHWRTLHEPYWRERVRCMRPVEFPYDGKAPEHAPLRWRITEFALGGELSVRLRGVASTTRMMLPLMMLGITLSALWHWCGQSEWTVGVIVHGRHGHPELANTVGAMVSMLPLCFPIRGEEHLLETIREIHAEYSAALEHQDYGRFGECKLSWGSIPMTFNWVATGLGRRHARRPHTQTAGAEITPFYVYQTQGNLLAPLHHIGFRILAEVEDSEAGMVFGIIHQDDVFTSHTLTRLWETIRMLVAAFVADPLTRPASLCRDA